MRPVKSYIAKRFQNSDAGLSLDTDALARYSDIIDLSIGDTDFITDDAIIDTAFREAKAGYTHYGDPKGDPELIRSVCDAWQTDFKQPLSPDHVLVTASSSMGMALVMLSVLDPGDEVIVFSPYFSLYRTQAELAGGVCVEVPTYAKRGDGPLTKPVSGRPSPPVPSLSCSTIPATPPAWAMTAPRWSCWAGWRRSMTC